MIRRDQGGNSFLNLQEIGSPGVLAFPSTVLGALDASVQVLPTTPGALGGQDHTPVTVR